MMRDTPRTFIGPVTLYLESRICRRTAIAVRDELAQLPGVVVCGLDAGVDRFRVTGQRPMDLGEVAAAVERGGARVRP